MRGVVLAVVVAGCGRLGFDDLVGVARIDAMGADGTTGGTDANPDGGTAVAPDAAQDAAACPPGYLIEPGQNSRYRLALDLTWTEALVGCDADLPSRTRLAVIEDLAENNAIAARLPGTDHWIGVSDLETEGVWLDSTGATQMFFRWAANQPDGGNTANCARIAPDGTWFDSPCSAARPSVCECVP